MTRGRYAVVPKHLNPPPGWPEPPRGWRPPPGWEPPPSWPHPPAHWPLWVEDPRTAWVRAHPVLATVAALAVALPVLAAADLLPGRLDEPPVAPTAEVLPGSVVVAGAATSSPDPSGRPGGSYGGAARAGSAALVDPDLLPDRVRIGDGEHRVGAGVEPGTYRSGPAGFCYWARLGRTDDQTGAVRARGSAGDEIVTIREDDVGFVTQGCGTWVPVAETAPEAPLASLDDGTYQVGWHIAPGTYRVEPGSDTDAERCLWSRLNDFEHDAGSNIANGNTVEDLVLDPDDVGFSTRGCGTWVRVD